MGENINNDSFAEFDKLKTELNEQLKCMGANDLDNLVNAHKKAVELHAKCTSILNEAQVYLANINSTPLQPVEWTDFKTAKSEIEKLSKSLDSENLSELITNYTQLSALICEYQRRLEETQNNIKILDES